MNDKKEFLNPWYNRNNVYSSEYYTGEYVGKVQNLRIFKVGVQNHIAVDENDKVLTECVTPRGICRKYKIDYNLYQPIDNLGSQL
jgi:hypothetical protein